MATKYPKWKWKLAGKYLPKVINTWTYKKMEFGSSIFCKKETLRLFEPRVQTNFSRHSSVSRYSARDDKNSSIWISHPWRQIKIGLWGLWLMTCFNVIVICIRDNEICLRLRVSALLRADGQGAKGVAFWSPWSQGSQKPPWKSAWKARWGSSGWGRNRWSLWRVASGLVVEEAEGDLAGLMD